MPVHSETRAAEKTSAARAATRKRRLWIAADVAAATVIGGGLWWRWLNAVPAVTVPVPPPLPRPNAFDSFTEASRLAVDADVIKGANSEEYLPRERNGVPYSDAEKAAAIARNAEALATLRSGFAFPFQHPARRGFEARFPELTQFRQMARLLNAEGQVREASGDFGGAAQSRLDAVQMGVEIPRGGPILPYVVGLACEKIGVRPLWDLTDRLSADEARAAAKRLEEMQARRVPFADALTEDKMSAQEGLLKVFRTKSLLQFAVDLSRGSEGSGTFNVRSFVSFAAPLMTRSKSRIFADYTAHADHFIEQSRLPYSVSATRALPPLPGDPVTAILFPVWNGVLIREADAKMQSSLLTAALALRAYQAEQGRYPADLEALVRDGYLRRVPADPFSQSGEEAVRYRRRENGTCLLYSVGPDGRDDSGTPIRATLARGRSQHRLEEDMRGDFVAGVSNIDLRRQE